MTRKTIRDLLLDGLSVTEAVPHLVAREKPVPTTKIIGIIAGISTAVFVGVTLTVVYFLHRRKKRIDQKEDAGIDMELEGDFEDHAGGISQPPRSRQRQQHQLRQQQDMYDSDGETEQTSRHQKNQRQEYHPSLEEQLNQQHHHHQHQHPQQQQQHMQQQQQTGFI